MGMTIKYHPVPGLPRLAWLACLDQNTFTELSVFHGSAVECRENWMVEGVWDGDFSSGNFHTAENFFGSGIRLEGDRLYFVPSSSKNDHLFYCIDRHMVLVSNSLIILLAFTGASLDDTHDYENESKSVMKGIKDYSREFTVIHPEIERFYQVFYENIIVTKDGISFEFKNGIHEINSFEQYYDLLLAVLSRIRKNCKDSNRTIPITLFSTISAGYDSTAVTSLAKKIGVETCFTVKKSASWIRWSSKYATDDGTLAAHALNLNVIHIDATRSDITEDELFFLSTNYGKSDKSAVLNSIAFSPMTAYIEQHCSAAIVFTGHHGDKVWNRETPEESWDEELKTHAVDLGFAEIRLKCGFIQIPVPYILARNVRSIVAISRSDEMKPWSLHKEYDRPIARRIAESSGIPRGAFGIYKKGAGRHFYRLPISRELRNRFLEYLRNRYALSKWFVYTNHVLNQTAFLFQKAFYRIFRPALKHRRPSLFWPDLDISFLLWIWAAHVLRDRFRKTFRDGGFGKLLR